MRATSAQTRPCLRVARATTTTIQSASSRTSTQCSYNVLHADGYTLCKSVMHCAITHPPEQFMLVQFMFTYHTYLHHNWVRCCDDRTEQKYEKCANQKHRKAIGILHSLIISREGLILTLSILPCPNASRPSRFPSGNLSGLGKSHGRRGWISNTSLVLVEHRYSVSAKEQKIPPTLNFLKLDVKYSWYYGAQ